MRQNSLWLCWFYCNIKTIWNARLIVIHQKVKIGREDADENEGTFYRFDKIRNLDGEAVEADILGNGGREEGCK